LLATQGRDRPGIVAGVVEPLTAFGCNIEDSRMAVLGGYFAMLMVARAPEDLDDAGLRAALRAARDQLALDHVELHPLADPRVAATLQSATHVVSARDADHPGIVLAISSALAGLSVNIRNLQTRLEGDPPVYAMLVEVVLPAGLQSDALEAALQAAAAAAGTEVTLRELGD